MNAPNPPGAIESHPRRRGILARGQLTSRERTTDRQPEGLYTHMQTNKRKGERERERGQGSEKTSVCVRLLHVQRPRELELALRSCSSRLVAVRRKSFAETSLSSAKRKGPTCATCVHPERSRKSAAYARARNAREGCTRSFAEGDKWGTWGRC